MNLRTCPDCRGTGRHWRPPGARTEIVPIASTTTEELGTDCTGFETRELPEYDQCELCQGMGKVQCFTAEVAKGR
ncbi:MAG: hypothetical protein PHU85_02025 [Phycisphaerae bacterium]|nr:hypothetical protein [Phycisphaerae bacterium]